MDSEMKHEGSMHGEHMHEGKMEMMHKHGHHHKPWQSNWKSPVALGIFALTASLALGVLLYTIVNVAAAVVAASHPQSQGITDQEMQQMMQQQAPASSGTNAATPAQ